MKEVWCPKKRGEAIKRKKGSSRRAHRATGGWRIKGALDVAFAGEGLAPETIHSWPFYSGR